MLMYYYLKTFALKTQDAYMKKDKLLLLLKVVGNARLRESEEKKERKEKIFIQMKYIWFHNMHILIVK